jgi:hypothetical protein
MTEREIIETECEVTNLRLVKHVDCWKVKNTSLQFHSETIKNKTYTYS